MDNKQLRTLFGFFGGLAFNLLLCILSVVLLSSGWATCGIALAALFALINLALVSKLSPDYNVGGKVVVGIFAGFLTTVALVWFMPWLWAGIFVVAQMVTYCGAIAKSIR